MNPQVFLGFCVLIAALLFLGGVVVLGLGTRAIASGISALHQARAHGAEADATADTLVAAKDAVDEIHQRKVEMQQRDEGRVGDEEITAALLIDRLAAREAADKARVMTNGEVDMPTKDENEGADTSPGMDGGFYAPHKP